MKTDMIDLLEAYRGKVTPNQVPGALVDEIICYLRTSGTAFVSFRAIDIARKAKRHALFVAELDADLNRRALEGARDELIDAIMAYYEKNATAS